MVQVAYQIPLKEPLVVPSETRSQPSFTIHTTPTGHNLEHVLEKTASSTFALRTPVNDNSALLAELNKRIQNNPRIKAAQNSSLHQPEAEQTAAVPETDREEEELDAAEAVLSAVERTQIELAETVQFIKALRADPERRMSKREAKQFLQFAATQAALSVVGEATVPQQDGAERVADEPAVAGHAQGIDMNPLALQALADSKTFNRVMQLPATEAMPKTAFQHNMVALTQAQPDQAAELGSIILPQSVQSELRLIAEDTQFNPDLVRQAQALQNPQAHAAALPQAMPQPMLALSNEDKVQTLITQAREEQAVAERLKLDAHVDNYMRARSLDITFTSGHKSSVKIDRALVNTNLQKTIDDKPDMSLSDRRIETNAYKLQIERNYDETINKQADMLMNSRWISSLDVRDGIHHNITHTAKADGTPIVYELNSNADEIAQNKAKEPLVRTLNSGLSGLSAA